MQTLGSVPTFLPVRDSLVAFFGTCLFSFYLAYHTKLIVAGKHSKYRMNEKDFVFGASKCVAGKHAKPVKPISQLTSLPKVTLYSDIIALLLRILELVADRDGDNG